MLSSEHAYFIMFLWFFAVSAVGIVSYRICFFYKKKREDEFFLSLEHSAALYWQSIFNNIELVVFPTPDFTPALLKTNPPIFLIFASKAVGKVSRI